MNAQLPKNLFVSDTHPTHACLELVDERGDSFAVIYKSIFDIDPETHEWRVDGEPQRLAFAQEMCRVWNQREDEEVSIEAVEALAII